MKWEVRVAGPARKQLDRVPTKDRERILAVLVGMQENPFQGDIQHLKNQPSAFRRRVGDWRILFDADPTGRFIVVNSVEHRTTTTYRRRQ